jgi:hypothetical protein
MAAIRPPVDSTGLRPAPQPPSRCSLTTGENRDVGAGGGPRDTGAPNSTATVCQTAAPPTSPAAARLHRHAADNPPPPPPLPGPGPLCRRRRVEGSRTGRASPERRAAKWRRRSRGEKKAEWKRSCEWTAIRSKGRGSAGRTPWSVGLRGE